jgi:hypothetical protein
MYKPNYNTVSKIKGNKKAGLAHLNSVAMMIDPPYKNSKSKKEVDLKEKAPTEHIAKNNGGTVELKRSTVEAAKAETGYFANMPKFQGHLMEENNVIYGYKTHEGKLIRSTNPVDRKKVKAKYEYDKKLYEKTALDKAARTKRMATPVDKESEK